VAGLIIFAFAKMHVFLRYGTFAGLVWSILVFFSLLIMIVLDHFPTVEEGKKIYDFTTGVGMWFALLADLGIIAAFAFLAYPEVMKLIKKTPTPAG
jgi:hypothetical protein